MQQLEYKMSVVQWDPVKGSYDEFFSMITEVLRSCLTAAKDVKLLELGDFVGCMTAVCGVDELDGDIDSCTSTRCRICL